MIGVRKYPLNISPVRHDHDDHVNWSTERERERDGGGLVGTDDVWGFPTYRLGVIIPTVSPPNPSHDTDSTVFYNQANLVTEACWLAPGSVGEPYSGLG